MKLPEPIPGLVIRHSFLWDDEAATGATEGRKYRPCAIILSAKIIDTNKIRIIVAPITHSTPEIDTIGEKVPKRICTHLGLDDRDHFIRFDILNEFIWPGYDLEPVSEDTFEYGVLSVDYYEHVKKSILTVLSSNKSKGTFNRD